jgi:hypothetical protein
MASPFFELLSEIVQQGFRRRKAIGKLLAIEMAVVSLSALIVETDDPFALPAVVKAIFEKMRASGTGSGTFQMTISTMEPSGRFCFERWSRMASMLTWMTSS